MKTKHTTKYSFTILELGDPGIHDAYPESLQDELCRIEPVKDLLHELCGCGQYAEITRTSDGFFLGRAYGDIGFNAFLGEPSEIGLRRTAGYLPKLSPDNRSIAESILSRFGLLRAVLAFDVPKIELEDNNLGYIGDDGEDEMEAQNDKQA